MPSPIHQAKRPYAGTHSAAQQSITSYFSSAAHPCASTNPSPLSQCMTAPLSPPLPASVQSNLLSVGMRVRKSVPEGYKTGQQYSAFSLFSVSKPTASLQASTPAPRKMTSYHRAELTPFCGILKVGGLGVQGFLDSDDVPEEDDVPFFSSQGSTITNASVDDDELARGKRRFDDDADEEDAEILDESVFGIWRDEEVSPRSKPRGGGSSFISNGGLGERRMAVPRGRRRGMVRQKSGEDQENAMMGIDLDFGEAEFLDFGAWKSDEMEL